MHTRARRWACARARRSARARTPGTPSWDTGPSAGNGSFYFVEATGGDEGDVHELEYAGDACAQSGFVARLSFSCECP